MKPVGFPESNKTLAPPRGMTEEECSTLEVYTDGEQCISCWELTDEELMEVLQTKRIWVHVWFGMTQPPIAASGKCPFKRDGEEDDQ